MTPHEIAFQHKPVIVAGQAMAHYGLRDAGDDIDMVVSREDFESLRTTHPVETGNYGDERIKIGIYELYDGFFGVPYDLLKHGALEKEDCLIASLPVLLYLASFYSGDDSELIIKALHAQNRL
jgi:hypothetical protein